MLEGTLTPLNYTLHETNRTPPQPHVNKYIWIFPEPSFMSVLALRERSYEEGLEGQRSVPEHIQKARKNGQSYQKIKLQA